MAGNLYGSTNPSFTPTTGQRNQARMLGSSALHCMAYGGAGSSKTFGWCSCIALRAIAVKHRALIVRRHFKHARQFIALQTWAEMMALVFPGIAYELNKSDWFIRFPHNGSEIWFGGLDDGKRMDKVLGPQYATIFINECSEISDYNAVILLRTRLREKTALANKMMYDQNPATKGHWTFKEFEQGINPLSHDEHIKDHAADYASCLMNPDQNWHNMSPEYRKTLEAMPERQRRRFLLGQYADEVEDALWSMDTIDHFRINPDQTPDLRFIVVACDPAVTANENSDETGIVVAGKGVDGHLYVLEDATCKVHPRAWGDKLVALYNQHRAALIVAEVNNGGDLVEVNIRACPDGGKLVPYESIHASRGKITRAEPIAALYERGLVHHVGTFRYLEDELTTYNPLEYDSPNRLDALVWACSKLAGTDDLKTGAKWGAQYG